MGQIPGQIPAQAGQLVDIARVGLNKWPQYDPNSGGINPEGGPFIPKAPVPQMAPTTNFAAQQMSPFGDTSAAGTMMGVKPKRKGR